MISITKDDVLDPIHPEKSLDELAKVLSLLCDQKVGDGMSREASETIDQFLKRVASLGANKVKLTFEEFNELLLLFNQDRVGRPFFSFFFLDKDPRNGDGMGSFSLADLKDGIRKFRAFAMLCFGNFRFAYRKLSEEEDADAFMKILDPWNRDSQEEERKLKNRKKPLASISANGDEILAGDTWLCGYISADQLKFDEKTLDAKVEQAEKTGKLEDQYEKASEELSRLLERQRDAREKGKRNTVKYLTRDCIDVYVATSMRHAWEYEETAKFINQVFHQELTDLPDVRWFDPTQSFSEVTIDKGLVEALMLKRAKCTIYMAQESDTLGKDSELAATLAQGKPVIAYIPRLDEKTCHEEMKQRPLSYFRQRLMALWADGFFEKADIKKSICERLAETDLEIEPDSLERETQEALTLLFKMKPEFQIISPDYEEEFRKSNENEVIRITRLMASIECEAMERRANTLKRKHPLNMQVELKKGVANGVLVARSAKDCATLLRGVLLRNLEFRIRLEVKKEEEGPDVPLATVLEEAVTEDARAERGGSRFRVVTEDRCLTNSFWNFYLEEEVN